MISYLDPKNGPVVDGLEEKEIVYAKHQEQYTPLRTLVSAGTQRRVFSRWTFTDEQRKAIADGADVFLELLTFGHPLQPIRMILSDGKLDPDWVRVCWLDETLREGKSWETSKSKLAPPADTAASEKLETAE